LQDIDFRVHDATADYCIATWRRVMFLVWKTGATAQGIEKSRQIMDSWGRRHRDGVMLVIVMPRILPSPPSEEARAAMARATQGKSNLKGIAVIQDGNWFVRAAIRGATASRNLIDRARIPTRIYAKVDDAATWISTCLGSDHHAHGLASAAKSAAQI
jgi:hypothetical protein